MTVRHIARFVSVAVVATLMLIAPLFTVQAFAQGAMATGEVEGVVQDPDGAGLPGATVTVAGQNLIQDSLTKVTGATGDYVFRALRPGSYVVTVEMPGFAGQLFNVSVQTGITAHANFILELEGVSETVTVSGETPLIDVTESSINANYGEELIQNIPIAREFVAVGDLTAGFTDRGAYGAGANVESDGTGRYRRGSSANAYKLNGVDVTEPDWGATWVNPSIDTVAEVQVVGIGASAEYGNFTGATINIVTKGGTNEFRGSLNWYYTSGSLRGDNSGGFDDYKRGDFRYDHDFSGTIGGPVIRNKLMAFGNYGLQRHNEANFGSPIYENTKRQRFHGRLDFLANDKNTFGVMLSSDPGTDENLGRTAGDSNAIGYGFTFGSQTWLASWQSELGDDSFLDFRYAGYLGDNFRFANSCNAENDRVKPPGCTLPGIVAWQTGISYSSSVYNWDETNGRHEINTSLTQYVDDFLGGSHTVKIGAEFEDTWSLFLSDYGPGWIWVGDYYGYTYSYGYTYDAHLDVGVRRYAAFVQDDITFSDNITANVGFRYDNPRINDNCCSRTDARRPRSGGIAGVPIPGGDPNFNGGNLTNYKNYAPRVGLNWDVTGEGKFVAHIGWGRYFEKALTYGPIAQAGNAYEAADDYFALLPAIDYNNIDGTQLVADTINADSFVDRWVSEPREITDLKMPRTDAFNVGVEIAVGRDYALTADYIYKSDSDFLIQSDANSHTYSPVEYTNPTIGTTQTLYVRTDDNPEDLSLTNDDYYFRSHHMAILAFRKRPSAGFNFDASITYQKSEGNIGNTVTTNWGFAAFGEHDKPNFAGHPFTVGPLNFDRTWQFKLLTNYRLPGGILASTYLQALSGRPWEPDIRARATGISFNDTRIRNIRLEPRGNRRAPSQFNVDLRLQKAFDVGNNRIELIADVFNLTNRANPWRRGYSSGEVDDSIGDTFALEGGSSFGLMRWPSKPREARLGIRFVW
jgi:hypothetical protein